MKKVGRFGAAGCMLALVCVLAGLEARPALAETAVGHTGPLKIESRPKASTRLNIPNDGNATLTAPVNITTNVGTVRDVDVRFHGINHIYPSDIWARVVAPDGKSVALMYQNCGPGFPNSTYFSNGHYTFDDEAAAALPDDGSFCGGLAYRPSGSLTGPWINPNGPTATTLTGIGGGPSAGEWKIQIYDSDADGNPGTIDDVEVRVLGDGAAANDDFGRPTAINASGSFETPAVNTAGTGAQAIPTPGGSVDEAEAMCGIPLGKSVWYQADLPSAGTLKLDAIVLPNGDDDVGFDPVLILAPVNGSGQMTGGGGKATCQDSGNPDVAESLTAKLPAGSYRFAIAGYRRTANAGSASDGTGQIRGLFVADQGPVKCADDDGDGICQDVDRCKTQKPTRDTRPTDGCQDKPERFLSTFRATIAPYSRGRRDRGSYYTKVRATLVPKGAKVTVTCSKCRRATRTKRGRRTIKRLKGFSVTAKRKGTLSLGRLNGLLLRRGQTLTITITASGKLGRRMIVQSGRKDRYACLAVGTRSKVTACSNGI